MSYMCTTNYTWQTGSLQVCSTYAVSYYAFYFLAKSWTVWLRKNFIVQWIPLDVAESVDLY